MMNKYGKMGAFVLCLFATFVVFGQGGPGREKIKTLKVAFITERLGLTSDEAQAFWPVYNEHEKNIQRIRRTERVEIQAKFMDMDLLTQSEASELLNQLMELEMTKQKLHIAFLEKMTTVISPKKTLLLIKAEEDFKRRLLREMQKRKGGG
ncbi:MAG: hypothetical protein ABF293_08435 [Flavobacteriaceae bacterium]